MKLKNLIPSSFDATQWTNLFNIYQDKDGKYFFNLVNSVQLKDEEINPIYFETHYGTESDNLFHLSHRYYDTISLWWLIAYVNKLDDPFFLEGKTLRIFKPEVVGQILEFVLETKQ